MTADASERRAFRPGDAPGAEAPGLQSHQGMWSTIRDAITHASPAVRRLAWQVVGFWLLMLALQVWDSRNASGVSGAAEFASVLFGMTGVALLGLAHTLHLAMSEAAARRPGEAALSRVLLALPLVGFAAGVALGVAAVLMGFRMLIGAEWQIATVGLTVYAVLTIAAGRVVMAAVRTLFDVASSQAAMAADLRAAESQARFDALQARVNPHVLFNALNTIVTLVRDDPGRAEQVTLDLADVLRAGLDRSSSPWTTLEEELRYTRQWLAIEQARWGDALHVEWMCDDAPPRHRVPAFVIQPLLENALKHGLGGRVEGGVVTVAVSLADGRLRLDVQDNGAGFSGNWRDGHGLGNLRRRLAALYGSDAQVTIARLASGARVSVDLPGDPSASALA